MAKTKKEMRKVQANYAEILLRKNKHIKELEEKLQAWEQVNRINQAITAAVLLIYGAEDKPVEIKQETVTKMLQEYSVLAKPHLDEDGDLDGYLLELKKKEESGE